MEKWVKFLRPYGVAAVCGLLMSMVWPPVDDVVVASPIKNWTSNEYIRYSDLNTVVNHLHANLGHGHGAIITANDIATNAGIRPEQTTFGSSINRSLVHMGTYNRNVDGGVNYLPVSYSGSLAVTVSTTANGFTVTGAANAGTLTDGGTVIYTVFTKATDLGMSTVYAAHICYAANASSLLYSPLSHTELCQTVASFGGAAAYVSPMAVSVAVYSNATVP